jgi:hypothetical protein
MRPADAAIPYEPAALARAFLALAETGGEPLPRRVPRVALALLSALTIALALPLHATATVPHKPALVAAADDDEPAGGA